jgi:uncharacterized protein YycO
VDLLGGVFLYRFVTAFVIIVTLLFSAVSIVAFPTSALAITGDDYYAGDGNSLDVSLARPGDIFLVKGTKKLSWAIPGYWEHTAMYVGDGMIVEGWPGGARYLPVEVINTADEAALIRVYTTSTIKENAVQFHVDRIGIAYDYVWVTKQIYGDRYYCSELNWASYKYQGVLPKVHNLFLLLWLGTCLSQCSWTGGNRVGWTSYPSHRNRLYT